MGKPLEDRIRHWNEKLERNLKRQEWLQWEEGNIRTKLQHLEIKREKQNG